MSPATADAGDEPPRYSPKTTFDRITVHVTCNIETPAVWRIGLAPSEDGGQTLIEGPGLARLWALLEEADASSRCRVLVLEGADGAFCQGMDLAYMSARSPEDRMPAALQFARCLGRLRGGRQLVVAAVDGAAIGGGVGLAGAADVLLCTEGSTFGLPELSLGLVPAIVLPVLTERMTAQRARWLALSGTIGARRALEMGLVDQVVGDAARLEKATRKTIKQALRCRPQSVAGLKWHLEQVGQLPLHDALEAGAQLTAESLNDAEGMAALVAFMEGEPLPWFERYKPGKRA